MKSYTFIGGDDRIFETYMLIKEHFSSNILCFEKKLPQNGYASINEICKIVAESDVVVLPIPYTRDGENVTAVYSDVKIPVACIVNNIKSTSKLYYGGTASLKKLPGINILEDERYIENNAALTAESFIKVVHEKYGIKLNNSSVIITGFGHVAKALLKVLKKYDCQITMAVRNPFVIKEIRDLGIDVVLLNELSLHISDKNIIVNTVPANIFSTDILRQIRPTSFLFDLASSPCGLDHTKINSPNIVQELGLPGKYAPDKEAAMIHSLITGK